jgi:hypothetical protein
LLEVADERGRLTSELREMGQALQVARFALQALSQVQARLGNPASWSSHVGFPRRHKGLIHSATAHSRLDELARMAAYADQCVWVLRVELADVSGVDMAPPAAMESLTTGLVTRFTDVWLEHTVSVPDRIRYAHHNVGRCMWLVNDVHNRLAQRAGAARTRLGQLEGERRSLLSGKA